jgi:hypothetical protein
MTLIFDVKQLLKAKHEHPEGNKSKNAQPLIVGQWKQKLQIAETIEELIPSPQINQRPQELNMVRFTCFRYLLIFIWEFLDNNSISKFAEKTIPHHKTPRIYPNDRPA